MAKPVSTVSTVAGSLKSGFLDGRGRSAKFCTPLGLDISNDGRILIADRENHCIREVELAGSDAAYVKTFAGMPEESGCRDGEGRQALFNKPCSVTVSSDGTVYVVDIGNNKIRKIDVSKVVSTLAGSGQSRTVDGKGDSASFCGPCDMTCAKGNSAGGFYVSEADGNCIRHVTEDGTVSTVAGTPSKAGHQNGDSAQAKFYAPFQLACTSSGETYVADTGNNAIRVLAADKSVKTIAGHCDRGFMDGAVEKSEFNYPTGVAVDEDGQCFVADMHNHRIRTIALSDGVQTVNTLVGCGEEGLQDGDGQHSILNCPMFLVLDHSTNTLYFTQKHCLCKVSLPRESLPQLQSSLPQDMLSLVDNQHLSDVVFKIEGKSVYASKNLLRLRSEYFDRMFSSGMKESIQTTAAITEVPIEDVDYESFKALIVYLMTDQLTVDPNDYKMICQLLIVSDRYLVDRLKLHCERLLERLIQADNVFELVHVAVSRGAERLKSSTLRYMTQHREIRQRPEMKQLPSHFLADVLKSI